MTFHRKPRHRASGNSFFITLKEEYEGLLENPLLENYLATKEVHLRISIIDNGNLIEAAKEIILLLEETND